MRLELNWDVDVPRVMRQVADDERRHLVHAIFSLVDDPIPACAEPSAKPNWYSIAEGAFRILYLIDSVEGSLTIIAIMKDGEWLNPDTM
ncbi:MAG: hypothetical protein ACE149_04145 [Armatimonadota bacterium]